MKPSRVLWIALLLLLLSACAPLDLTEDESVSLGCRIVDGAETGALLLAGDDEEVYTLGIGDDIAVTLDGASVDRTALRDGMKVTVTYDGDLLETWPVQFSGVRALAAESADTDDRCGLYLQVLEDLWNIDPGLNSDDGLNYLGMDLSGLTHLTQTERAAVAWCFAGKHNLELIEGTWEELCDAGYIDRENLFWEDGILFTITTDEDAVWNLPGMEPGDEMPVLTAFDANKWRSGLGAYFFGDCVAQRHDDGTWSYSVRNMAIS